MFDIVRPHFFQILIDSAIDLEVPAHKTSGFLTYVYPTNTGPTSVLHKVTIPVHAHYHEPSFVGETFTSVRIEPPELLLRTEKCKQFILEKNIYIYIYILYNKCTYAYLNLEFIK